MNTFISYPVGQGFFYSGTIKNFQLVYDCGGANVKKSSLVDSIDYYSNSVNSQKNERGKGIIDMLVLSHFDRDHVNGIVNLLSKFDVKKLYIPYYKKTNILYLINFIMMVSDTEIERIIMIDSYDENIEIDEEGEDLEDVEIDGIPIKLIKKVKKGKSSFFLKKIEWEFYLFNTDLGSDDVLKKIISKLEKRMNKEMKKLNVKDETELLERIKGPGFKKIFKEIIGEKNTELGKKDWSNNISLCLYHKPHYIIDSIYGCNQITDRLHSRCSIGLNSVLFCDNECAQLKALFCDHYDIREGRGTLLTGDINLNELILANFKKWVELNSLEKDLGVVYLPHHGAIKNWNVYLKKLVTTNNALTITSAGKNSQYNHPNPVIVMDYDRSRLPFFQCNEDNYFEYTVL